MQAAIEVLDDWLDGRRADAALTAWGRAHRFAGSGDRAAIRDHVFDAIRCRRSFAALGGAETGRGLMLGAVRARGADPAAIFGAGPHAPAPLGPGEAAAGQIPSDPGTRLDAPDWLLPVLRDSLGPGFEAALAAGQARAPVFLRVNLNRAARPEAVALLAEEGIAARPCDHVATALEVVDGARRIARSRAYADGRVEVQDAHSQAVTADLRVPADTLDFCAGAGGKALALAALAPPGTALHAHDADPARMRDLPDRARRAGAEIRILTSGELPAAPAYDLVLCDAPCSGSGTWRRDPEAKWRLDHNGLNAILQQQRAVLDAAGRLVRPGGRLVYVTCSVLRPENEDQVAAWLDGRAGWRLEAERRWPVGPGGDGFFRAILVRDA